MKKHLKDIAILSVIFATLLTIAAGFPYGFDLDLLIFALALCAALFVIFSLIFFITVKLFKKDPKKVVANIEAVVGKGIENM